DSSGCSDLKKLMDRKLQEITDLRGQLEDKAKEMGREKIREALEESPAGELLALLEFGEKEYGRLERLFNECMMEFENKKRIIIVHGWSGSPDANWLPWLASELK